MNRVAVNAAEVPLPQWHKNAGKFAKKVLKELGRDNWDLSVLLCDDCTIKALNSRFRSKMQATDVLSFSQEEGRKFPSGRPAETPSGERFLPGDIVISLDFLKKNARQFKISEDQELRRLLIHGILHLDGMDHLSNRRTEPMLLLQEQILENLSGEHILGSGT